MQTWKTSFAPSRPRVIALGQILDVPAFTNLTAVGGLLLLSGSLAFMLASKKAPIVQQVARGASAAFGAYLVASQTQVRHAGSFGISDSVLPVLGMTAVAAALTGLGYWALKGKV